jgi:hypothetical protein
MPHPQHPIHCSLGRGGALAVLHNRPVLRPHLTCSGGTGTVTGEVVVAAVAHAQLQHLRSRAHTGAASAYTLQRQEGRAKAPLLPFQQWKARESWGTGSEMGALHAVKAAGGSCTPQNSAPALIDEKFLSEIPSLVLGLDLLFC